MELIKDFMKESDYSQFRMILSEGRFTTLALSDGNEPYTLSLYYAQDPRQDILYFLTDKGGAKLDYFKSDPYVCGTVISERDSSVSSVVYRGLIEVVHKKSEQERILKMLRSRNFPFLRIKGEDEENSMYLKLVIEEMSFRCFT